MITRMTRKGEWLQTFTGKQFWPLDPCPEEICIEDIAHALSLQCRFGGHCKEFYSVAEHSWRVSFMCDATNALWGLLHDAAEAYLVDLPLPLKHFSALGEKYQLVEQRLMVAVCLRFGLEASSSPNVKESDRFMLHWEARDLMSPHPAPWAGEGCLLPAEVIKPLLPKEAEAAFLERFRELYENNQTLI